MVEDESLSNCLAFATQGYVEYEASVIMTEQQALNYAETLRSAINDVKEFRSAIIDKQSKKA